MVSFIFERVPILIQVIISFGFSLSLSSFSKGEVNHYSVFLSALISFLFLTQLRLMDEVKDFEKDKIANPKRPLPSGKVSVKEVKNLSRVIDVFFVLLLTLATLINTDSLLPLGFTYFYLYLMYFEFFIGEKLQSYPFTYAISHQVIIIPFIYGLGELIGSDHQSFYFAMACLAGFFSYEVGRKLNPDSHPVLKTYLQQFGLNTVIFVSIVLMGIALFYCRNLGIFELILPTSILYLISTFVLKWKPHLYKLSEGLVSVNLILILWATYLKTLI